MIIDQESQVLQTRQAPEVGCSVVICAYTEARWEAMVAAIEAVKTQGPWLKEIILVIDHNPSLLERVRQQIQDVVLIENQQERGLSGARNTGLAIARGELIVFVDEDAIPQAGWLERLVHTYQDSSVMGVGGAIEPLWEGGRPAWFPPEFDWVVGCTYLGMPEQTAPVRNLIGCNMSFRREVFEQIEGFRSNMGRIGTLPEGCEETELCIRLNQSQPQQHLVYQPSASVKHRVPGSRANWRYFLSRCYAEGISKAKVARLVGSKDGLASERSYTFRTLPVGVLRGLRDGILHGDRNGFQRAAAIISGFALTAAGYLVGSLSGTQQR